MPNSRSYARRNRRTSGAVMANDGASAPPASDGTGTASLETTTVGDPASDPSVAERTTLTGLGECVPNTYG